MLRFALGLRCGNENILAAGESLEAARAVARAREDVLRRDYHPDMGSCRQVVMVAPDGKVTGAPVKFVGLGEKYDALEGFYPERIVSRVMGMGDLMSLIERAEQTVDRKAAMDLERKLRKEEFTLEDFRDQLKQIRKMGPLEQLVGMLPKVGPLQNLPKDAQVDEGKLKQVEAIINSMTNQERRDHNVIDGKRRKRIAKGSGTSVQDVNQVLKQYLQMRTMMKQYGAMAARAKMKGLGKLAGLS